MINIMDREILKNIVEIIILFIVLITICVVQYPKITVRTKRLGMFFVLLAITFFLIGIIISKTYWLLSFMALGLFFISLSLFYFLKTASGINKISYTIYMAISICLFLFVLYAFVFMQF